MLLTKVCTFYELSEAILPFGLRYFGHRSLFQFLHRYLSLHVQFCLYVFQGKIAPQFWKTVSLIWQVPGDHLAFTNHALTRHYSLLLCVRPRSNVLNILTEQHWTFVQQSWVLLSDVQLLGGQTCWPFCWTRLNFALTITHCARTNWTNVQWLVKRTEQHSTSWKTKEMLSRSTFVQWKLWSRSNFTEQDSTRVNKAQQGGQTLWTFHTQ